VLNIALTRATAPDIFPDGGRDELRARGEGEGQQRETVVEVALENIRHMYSRAGERVYAIGLYYNVRCERQYTVLHQYADSSLFQLATSAANFTNAYRLREHIFGMVGSGIQRMQ